MAQRTLDLATVRQFGNIELLARQLVEGFITGLHRSPYHGFSVEFAEHKIYNPGEDIRHIDWKVYARTDRLYTKRYEEETNLRARLLVDTSPSMYYPEADYGKLSFSVLAAASLAYLLQKQRDAVGLTTFSDQVEWESPTKSTPSHLHHLFMKLENMLHEPPEQKQTSVAETIHQIAERTPRRSMVLIFSDMFDNQQSTDELFAALQHLKHKQHEVMLFHVADKTTELDFNFDERPYEFRDLESGEKVKVHPSRIREEYLREINAFFQELKIRCGQYKIDFIEADVRHSIDQVLFPFLMRRQKMR